MAGVDLEHCMHEKVRQRDLPIKELFFPFEFAGRMRNAVCFALPWTAANGGNNSELVLNAQRMERQLS